MNLELPRILVGVDFSPVCDRVIEEARRLAQQMGAQLDFVHISPLPPSAPMLPLPLDPSDIEIAYNQLDVLEHQSRADGFVAKTHLGVGSPIAGLCDFIRRLKPVLVVVGSHGRGAVMHLLVGSVAESLLRCSPVPVLVVPAAERVAHNGEAAA